MLKLIVPTMTVLLLAGLTLTVGAQQQRLSPHEKVSIDVGRSLPVLPLLYLVYFGILATGYPIPPEYAGIITLGVNLAFYMAELFRSGLRAVPRGMIEAGLDASRRPSLLREAASFAFGSTCARSLVTNETSASGSTASGLFGSSAEAGAPLPTSVSMRWALNGGILAERSLVVIDRLPEMRM
jgi:His/Glu/Gln/Arg/opine family amino acid ABC transporter permease subunit